MLIKYTGKYVNIYFIMKITFGLPYPYKIKRHENYAVLIRIYKNIDFFLRTLAIDSKQRRVHMTELSKTFQTADEVIAIYQQTTTIDSLPTNIQTQELLYNEFY